MEVEQLITQITPSTEAWCHICNQYVDARYIERTLYCGSCNSTFCEARGQNVEEFIAPPPPSSSSSSASSSTASGTTETEAEAEADATAIGAAAAALSAVASLPLAPELLSGPVVIEISHHQIPVPLFPGPFIPPFGLPVPLFGVGPRLGGSMGVRRPDDQLAQIMHHILMNENSYAASPPLSEEHIQALPRVQIASQEQIAELGEVCSIMQDPYEIGDTVIQLQCKHCFKEEALVQWLKRKDTCPVCRVKVNRPV